MTARDVVTGTMFRTMQRDERVRRVQHYGWATVMLPETVSYGKPEPQPRTGYTKISQQDEVNHDSYLVDVARWYRPEEERVHELQYLRVTNMPLYVKTVSSRTGSVMLQMNLARLQMYRFKLVNRCRRDQEWLYRVSPPMFIKYCLACDQTTKEAEYGLLNTCHHCFASCYVCVTKVLGLETGTFSFVSDGGSHETYQMAGLVFMYAWMTLKWAARRWVEKYRKRKAKLGMWQAILVKSAKQKVPMMTLPWQCVEMICDITKRPCSTRYQHQIQTYGRCLKRPNYELLCAQDAAEYFNAKDGVMDVGGKQWSKKSKTEIVVQERDEGAFFRACCMVPEHEIPVGVLSSRWLVMIEMYRQRRRISRFEAYNVNWEGRDQ